MQTVAVIPARYASTRFPGKPLALLGEKPMIQWVYERTSNCKSIQQTIVATDDERIYTAVKSFGGQVMMTYNDHPSGTDRVAEIARKTQADLILNVQGDEPFVEVEQLEQLIRFFSEDDVDIATLAHPITASATIQNPNVVKVVLGKDEKALYFSRSPIPYLRGQSNDDWGKAQAHFQHLGIYAYRKSVLEEITRLPPGRLEQLESLEQLRWLEAGYHISVGITEYKSIGVDTPADLQQAEEYLKNRSE